MGEGLKLQMFHVSSSSSSRRAEDDDEEVGEDSDSDSPKDENSTTKDPSLHELSSLVSHLPVKKGLSKFYQGKSQSFSSFSDVKTVEDLAKKETPIKRTIRPSRSYAGGLDDDEARKSQDNKVPPMMPTKGNPTGVSCAHTIARTSSSGTSYFAKSTKPPPIPTHNKNMM